MVFPAAVITSTWVTESLFGGTEPTFCLNRLENIEALRVVKIAL